MTERFAGDPSLRFATFGMTGVSYAGGERGGGFAASPFSPTIPIMCDVIPNAAKRSEGSTTNRSVIGIRPDYEGIMNSRHW